ncbi:uncharacterized protein LOC132315032 [Cornus florida]|uniref:uncharacterized protein LOC132315032 n=1 Tax=Cornus florida TaxID=4283 RepID=UPI00289B51BB|nr:uncharacterized protein LOC132315032 [Cornus florida]
MSQLHTSLHFHLTPINRSSHRDLIVNSRNFCPSIITGAENSSRLCYPRLWESRNRRALMLIAWTGGVNEYGKRDHESTQNEAEDNDTYAPPHKRHENTGRDFVKQSGTQIDSSDIVNFINISNIQNQAIFRPLINCHITKQIWMEFKKKLEYRLRKRLRELTENDVNSMEHVLEMVDLLYLLKMFNISDPNFETFVQKADDGEKQLREGLDQAKEGYDKLKLAVSDALRSSTRPDSYMY